MRTILGIAAGVVLVGFAVGCGSSGGGYGGSAGSANSAGCHKVTGLGPAEDCNYQSSAAPGASCPNGYKPGSCPTKGVYGCCVDTASSQTFASCYYSSSAGVPSKVACSMQAGHKWQGSPP
jgi:hypothetical protein